MLSVEILYWASVVTLVVCIMIDYHIGGDDGDGRA